MKKIMFNDRYGLTEAVLSGRKTQTRRLIPKSTLEKVDKFVVDYHNATFDVLTEMEALRHYFFVEEIGKLPFKVGEVVAIAQAYKDFGAYCIDGRAMTNKMFVKAEYMPHHIRITNVRVERLQDISDEDCIKEGIVKRYDCGGIPYYKLNPNDGTVIYRTPQEAYAALIDKISGKGTWKSNPYVFVYDFELVK